jgi:hypothetical protein
MAIKDFGDLRNALSEFITEAPSPKDLEKPEGMEHIALAIGDVLFLLCDISPPNSGRALLFCEFGPLPELHRVAALERLMELNLLFFRGNSPVFGRDPVNGNILFCSEILFKTVTPEAVRDSLHQIAAQARLWRRSHFLEDSAQAPGIRV